MCGTVGPLSDLFLVTSTVSLPLLVSTSYGLLCRYYIFLTYIETLVDYDHGCVSSLHVPSVSYLLTRIEQSR